MIYGYSDNKEQLDKRLNRVEGQVRGIKNMVANDKYCIDILTQIGAVKAALDKVAVELIKDHAKHCLSNSNIDNEDNAEELATAISRML